MALFEQRNHEGKTALYIAVESKNSEFVTFLMENYPKLNMSAKDTFEGNTPMHITVKNGDLELTKLLFNFNPELCMVPNFKGQTPFNEAVNMKDFDLLKNVFADFKQKALQMRDRLGENVLFECARREGYEDIYNWFMGTNDFYKARGT